MDKSKDETKTIQWHQGFYSGLELELREYKDILTFETEHQLNREPLRIDVLVIRKTGSRDITRSIGAFFRGHNIIEESPGILRVENIFHIPIRVVITSKLGEEYASLRMLATDIRQEDIMRFLTQSNQLTEKDDREHIADVLTVSTAVNQKKYERVKEDQTMVGPSVLELMKDELEEIRAAGIEQGIAQGRVEGRAEAYEDCVRTVVDLCKGFGGSSLDAVEKIVANMGLSETEANQLVKKYW